MNWTVASEGIYYFDFAVEPGQPKLVKFYSFKTRKTNRTGAAPIIGLHGIAIAVRKLEGSERAAGDFIRRSEERHTQALLSRAALDQHITYQTPGISFFDLLDRDIQEVDPI
jgi:hypothetical protein